MPTTFGKVIDVNLHMTELKIFHEGSEDSDEAHVLNSLIQDGK